jgi:hypothetical protein
VHPLSNLAIIAVNRLYYGDNLDRPETPPAGTVVRAGSRVFVGYC